MIHSVIEIHNGNYNLTLHRTAEDALAYATALASETGAHTPEEIAEYLKRGSIAAGNWEVRLLAANDPPPAGSWPQDGESKFEQLALELEGDASVVLPPPDPFAPSEQDVAAAAYDITTTVDPVDPFPVCARQLHRDLGIGRAMTTWIKDRIREFGFADGDDYIARVSGRYNHSYRLTLSAAIRIAAALTTMRAHRVWSYLVAAAEANSPEVAWVVTAPVEGLPAPRVSLMRMLHWLRDGGEPYPAKLTLAWFAYSMSKIGHEVLNARDRLGVKSYPECPDSYASERWIWLADAIAILQELPGDRANELRLKLLAEANDMGIVVGTQPLDYLELEFLPDATAACQGDETQALCEPPEPSDEPDLLQPFRLLEPEQDDLAELRAEMQDLKAMMLEVTQQLATLHSQSSRLAAENQQLIAEKEQAQLVNAELEAERVRLFQANDVGSKALQLQEFFAVTKEILGMTPPVGTKYLQNEGILGKATKNEWGKEEILPTVKLSNRGYFTLRTTTHSEPERNPHTGEKTGRAVQIKSRSTMLTADHVDNGGNVVAIGGVTAILQHIYNDEKAELYRLAACNGGADGKFKPLYGCMVVWAKDRDLTPNPKISHVYVRATKPRKKYKETLYRAARQIGDAQYLAEGLTMADAITKLNDMIPDDAPRALRDIEGACDSEVGYVDVAHLQD